jgi:hypothetical protein
VGCDFLPRVTGQLHVPGVYCKESPLSSENANGGLGMRERLTQKLLVMHRRHGGSVYQS